MSPPMEVWSLNHWTTKEGPRHYFFKLKNQWNIEKKNSISLLKRNNDVIKKKVLKCINYTTLQSSLIPLP